MTPNDVVELFAAAALLFATMAHYNEICNLRGVGLDFALTAVLLAAATFIHALIPKPLSDQTAGVLLLCAQATAAVAAWHIYRGAEEEPGHGRA
jgi:hypothetical protein